MRLHLVAAAWAAREPQSSGYSWDTWDLPHLREQAASVFRPISKLELPHTPYIESVPEGAASRAIAVVDRPAEVGSLVEQQSQYDREISDANNMEAYHVGDTNLPESQEAAPVDGYHDCAYKGENCHCDSGTVRYGARGCTLDHDLEESCAHKDQWTQPVKLGEQVSHITCGLSDVQKYRVWLDPVDGSPDPLMCQCLRREVTIQIDMGNIERSSSFIASQLETTHNMTEYLKVQREKSHSMFCLQSGGAVQSMLEVRDDSLVERDEVSSSAFGSDRVSGVIKPCLTDMQRQEGISQDEKFIFYKSTGQLKHVATGKCLSAEFTYAMPMVLFKDCTLKESQHHVQRWDIAFYTSSNFMEGKGYIKLGYGSHSRASYCLAITDSVLDLVKCISPQTIQWTVKAWEQIGISAGHKWHDCSAEDENCACANGEVRMGDSDTDTWTPGVPVDDTIVCSLSKLRSVSVPDPVSDATGNVKCQCRHDAYVDGDADPHTSRAQMLGETAEFKRNHAPGLVSEAKSMMTTGLVAGAALLLGALGGAFAFYKWKQKQDYGEEEWFDEEEEEEYDEEEYEDDE